MLAAGRRAGYAPAMTQRWRTLVLLYPVLDARYGSGLQRGRARRVMTREERGVVMDVVERLPATVAAWSDGLATLEPFDVIEVRRSVRSLSSSGGGRWWVGPREVRPELERSRPPARPTTPSTRYGRASRRPAVRLGLHARASERRSARASPRSRPTTGERSLTDPDPEQGYVHEWLHQVEAVYRALGVSEAELPPLHDAGIHVGPAGDEAPFGRLLRRVPRGVDGAGPAPGRPGIATG